MLSKRDLILFVEELTIKLIVPDTSLTTVCNLKEREIMNVVPKLLNYIRSVFRYRALSTNELKYGSTPCSLHSHSLTLRYRNNRLDFPSSRDRDRNTVRVAQHSHLFGSVCLSPIRRSYHMLGFLQRNRRDHPAALARGGL